MNDMKGARQPHSWKVSYRVHALQERYGSEIKRRAQKWWLELPFFITKGLTNWKTMVVVAGIIAYVFPCTYIWIIKALPKSYYYVGSVKELAGQMKLRPWSIDLNWVDNARRTERLSRLLSAPGKIARLPKESYIPARSGGSGMKEEYLGRQWNGGSCLYIAAVKLVAARVNSSDESSLVPPSQGNASSQEIDKAHPLTLQAYEKTLPSDFNRSCKFADVGDCKAKALLNCDTGSAGKACREKIENICPSDPPDKTCPAISVWLKGTPVPCFLL